MTPVLSTWLSHLWIARAATSLVNNFGRKSVLNWDISQQSNDSSHTSRNNFWESRGGDAIKQWNSKLLLTTYLGGSRKWGRGPFPLCSPCPFLSLTVITKLSTLSKWKIFPSCIALGKSPISLVLLLIHSQAHMHTHRCTYTHLRPPLPSLGGIVTTENPFYSPCTALQQHPNCSCSVPSLSTQQSNQNPPLPPSLSLLISSLLLSPASQASPATPLCEVWSLLPCTSTNFSPHHQLQRSPHIRNPSSSKWNTASPSTNESSSNTLHRNSCISPHALICILLKSAPL